MSAPISRRTCRPHPWAMSCAAENKQGMLRRTVAAAIEATATGVARTERSQRDDIPGHHRPVERRNPWGAGEMPWHVALARAVLAQAVADMESGSHVLRSSAIQFVTDPGSRFGFWVSAAGFDPGWMRARLLRFAEAQERGSDAPVPVERSLS